MNPAIKNIFLELEKLKLDAMIVSQPCNISYLTQTKSRDSYLIVSKKKNIYITDSRYLEEAKRDLRGCSLRKIEGSVFKAIASSCKELGLLRVAFEERYLPFAEYNKIREELDYSIELIPAHSLVERSRQVKTSEELEKIKKAVSITVKAFKFIQGFLAPGKKELEVAAEIERFIRYNGASTSSFDIIVASGPNSSFPHHLTGERRIRDNEPVLIDMGVDYLGYKSDLTRVFFLGKINISARRIYDIVLKAQKQAINKIRPGIKASDIDSAARSYITSHGYGKCFGHSLGHGIGLEVHEEPSISKREDCKLSPGMVFTIEPAIYIPGKFGVRIEDICVVTRKGVEVISGTLNK